MTGETPQEISEQRDDEAEGFLENEGAKDPFTDQLRAQDASELQDWGKGCVLGIFLPGIFFFIGVVLALTAFPETSPIGRGNQVLGTMSAFGAVGVLLGAWAFLRILAVSVYLRGALGLPDLHLLPRSAKIGPRSPTAIKVFSGLVTWAAAYLVMLAAVSFLMDANPSLGYIVLWAGLPLGPLLGILVATRIALADPLPELYE